MLQLIDYAEVLAFLINKPTRPILFALNRRVEGTEQGPHMYHTHPKDNQDRFAGCQFDAIYVENEHLWKPRDLAFLKSRVRTVVRQIPGSS